MNNILKKALPVLALLPISYANAIPFEPSFSDYPFPGTQFVVDSAANDFFSDTYGISVGNSYLYKDSRDTFDGIGIANGILSGSDFVGQILFLDTTDFVSIDYWSIRASTYRSYDASNNLLQEFSNTGSGATGVYTFDFGTIARLDFFADASGYATVSGLRYDFDGVTDGENCDITECDPVENVPLPGTLALFGLGLTGLGWSRRKKSV